MALFNWFSYKSDTGRRVASQSGAQPARQGHSTPALSTIPPASHLPPAMDPTNRSEERKAKRQARREQLYSAIRQAMTRAGVLSASFKFKVLSLDQRGDQFMVMMDVHSQLGLNEEKLAESEALIMQSAKTQFGILVTAVYWRVDAKAESSAANHAGFESKPAPLMSAPAPLIAAIKKPEAARYEPIADDEVTAFKRALAASAAQTPAVPDSSGKGRSGLRSYTLITGFEDTEMTDSSAVPALSATQYGDLN